MPKSPADTESSAEYGAFSPGTIVLAKLKSFPPWPGVVIPNELITEGVLKSKPKLKAKTSAGKARGRRRGGRKPLQTPDTSAVDSEVSTIVDGDDQEKLWCVRFLKDDTFMWATSKDISLLDEETIKRFLDNNKKAKKTIRGAYEMALNPPDLEEFIIYGSDGKPIEVDNEADDEDFKDDDLDEDEEVEDTDDSDDVDEENEASEDEVVHARKRKSTRKSATSSPVKKRKIAKQPPKTKRRKNKAVEDPETSGDEDWENDIFEETEPIAVDIPTSKDLQAELKSYTPKIKKLKAQLLILFNPSNKQTPEEFDIQSRDIKILNSLLDSVYGGDEIAPVALIRQLGLSKVIISILKQPILFGRKDLTKFREKLNSFLERLFGLTVEVDDNWTYKEVELPVVEGEHKEDNGHEAKDSANEDLSKEVNAIKDENH